MKDQLLHDKLSAAIRTATEEVFATMLGTEITAQPSYADHKASRPTDGVVGLIGLAGNWVGTGSIACSAELACKLSAQLLMSEYEAVNEEVLDAVAEVTNMIIGNVKTLIEDELGPLGLSIPTVVFGRNFTTLTAGTSDWTIVPFLCGSEKLEVNICLTPAKTQLHVRPGFVSPTVVGN
ncbi:MAG: chemotaxis protein CheX [Bryobacterales bacterium]|nr:chemotaxis protein CheX [Bryobacterales bacterium]